MTKIKFTQKEKLYFFDLVLVLLFVSLLAYIFTCTIFRFCLENDLIILNLNQDQLSSKPINILIDDKIFDNLYLLGVYLITNPYTKVVPAWIIYFPYLLILYLSCCCSCSLGAIITSLRMKINNNFAPNLYKTMMQIIFGFLTGLIAISFWQMLQYFEFINYNISPFILISFCLLAGLCWKFFYVYIEIMFKKFLNFKTKNSNSGYKQFMKI